MTNMNKHERAHASDDFPKHQELCVLCILRVYRVQEKTG